MLKEQHQLIYNPEESFPAFRVDNNTKQKQSKGCGISSPDLTVGHKGACAVAKHGEKRVVSP